MREARSGARMSLCEAAVFRTRANRAQSFVTSLTQHQEPLHDTQDDLGASGGVELAEDAGQIGVDGVARNAQQTSNAIFGVIIENAADDLHFPGRESARTRNNLPRVFRKHFRSTAD